MEIWQILLIVLGSIIILLVIASYILGKVFYNICFSRRKGDEHFAELENPEDKKRPSRIWFANQKLEEIEMLSFDNLKLKGYFLDNHSNKLAIICHGYRGRYYSSTTQAQIFYEQGYDIFLPNNRAHDTSEGKTFTMGPKETKDLLKWIDLMIKRNPNYEICLMGISMGAHIVMMSVGKSLPSNVKCFIEDCGYSSLDEIVTIGYHQSTPIKHGKLVVLCGELYAVLFKHHSFNDNTKKSLANCKIPGLFIHGDKDGYVPYTNLNKNYSYLANDIYKEKVTFEGAEHNKSVFQYGKYKNSIVNFIGIFIK